ncbi:type IV secretory pathway VirB6 component (fragment) [Escherichia coli]
MKIIQLQMVFFYDSSTTVDFDGMSYFIREGANKRGNSSRLTQSFHFFMFEPIFSPVNALNQPI